MISVLILTKNEKFNIRACIESVSWCDDIHVYDTFSEDGTAEIAAEMGANVHQREFPNWSEAQNWARENLPYKHPWVFYLDADERCTPKLELEMKAAILAADKGTIAFEIPRDDYWGQSRLAHVQASHYYVRLYRPDKIHFERLVNPETKVNGKATRLSESIVHYPFSKGIDQWFDRHNSYSSLEARQVLSEMSHEQPGSEVPNDYRNSRATMKRVFERLPFRPTVRFLYLYVWKRGFLDGRAGWRYARLQMIYQMMIDLKIATIKMDQTDK